MITATMTQVILRMESSDLAVAKDYCDSVGYMNNYGKPLTKGQIAYSVFKSFVEDIAKPHMQNVEKEKELEFDTQGLLTEVPIDVGDKNEIV